ncbi:uncharacterized protein EI90DRAFT_3134442 [Cantharellus anzutake]|uniref:uncharacterized protein n=1 Tax=Cantharellus anzutake TaxID=1750568 RepID=UPI001906896F|nr:uncharacterized protein EI90DRAFT_3134442 [Cantharellus anzutake]KAF8316447.1 hypothetical protein EI90DRAFT_3134442 [Cantharellus anzutake]
MSVPQEEQNEGETANTAKGIQKTPIRSGSRPSLSSASQSRLLTGTLKSYRAGEMEEPIRVDLESTQKCKVVDMIDFLLAFCLSGKGKVVSARDEQVLSSAFEKVKEVANQEGTTLRTELSKFLKAGTEAEMCDPFVIASNYALDQLSKIDIKGLPQHSADKQIATITTWTHTCTASSKNLELAWKKVRSTVEVKPDRLPMQVNPMRTFNNKFEDLKESEPCTPFDDDLSSIRRMQPKLKCECAPLDGSRESDRVAARKGPITPERISEWAHPHGMKPKTEALNDHNTTKRSKTEKDAAGSSKPPAVPLVDIQNGVYAAGRLSCSVDITHAINFILHGSQIYITWSDRQSVIRTGGFNIVDDLPHFLLVLLIMQRFDLAHWGFFTAFEGSSICPERRSKDSVFKTTLIQDTTIHTLPNDDLIYGGVNLTGRSTVVAGVRKADGLNLSTLDIQEANDLVAKASWPEETRTSESNTDLPYVTCSMGFIRKFLDLDTTRVRALRFVILDRLGELKRLDGEHMLIAYLDCFFCHWALWERNICHGDISTRNLMYKPDTKCGVLVDFDLARLGKQKELSGKDNTGTMPFMALDLLSEKAIIGSVLRLYQHDSESFAWCLIYICICMDKGDDDEILTISPRLLSSWFKDPGNCRASKAVTETATLLAGAPLHRQYRNFAEALRRYWVARFNRQMAAEERAMFNDPFKEDTHRLFPEHVLPKSSKKPNQDLYEEPSNQELLGQVYRILADNLGMIPSSRRNVLVEKLTIVTTIYPFVRY